MLGEQHPLKEELNGKAEAPPRFGHSDPVWRSRVIDGPHLNIINATITTMFHSSLESSTEGLFEVLSGHIDPQIPRQVHLDFPDISL